MSTLDAVPLPVLIGLGLLVFLAEPIFVVIIVLVQVFRRGSK